MYYYSRNSLDFLPTEAQIDGHHKQRQSRYHCPNGIPDSLPTAAQIVNRLRLHYSISSHPKDSPSGLLSTLQRCSVLVIHHAALDSEITAEQIDCRYWSIRHETPSKPFLWKKTSSNSIYKFDFRIRLMGSFENFPRLEYMYSETPRNQIIQVLIVMG